jgi:hypothetical protein
MGTTKSSELATQREFFLIVEEFFSRATGGTYRAFKNQKDFADSIRSQAFYFAERARDAYPWVHRTLGEFYLRHRTAGYSTGKSLGGMKLVLGGGSRFRGSQLSSVRKMLLYADTVLVPDPMLPWIEARRDEERFRNVLLLETAYTLLHMKPLVDVNLPYPAVVIFPSWEKTFEQQDATTISGIQSLATSVFSHMLDAHFENMEEVVAYVRTHAEAFLRRVDEAGYFVAPGGTRGIPLAEAVKSYRKEIQRWRSKEWVAAVEKCSEAELVLNGFMERFIPQYHLLENAHEFSSQPMLALSSQWHYYELCAGAFEARLRERALLDPRTIASLRAINQPRLKWLGNPSIEELVVLRENNENEKFRRRLEEFTNQLREASLSDLDRVAAEVARGIASLLAEHRKTIKDIQRKYQRKHTQTALMLGVTMAALFVPSLAPFAPLPSISGLTKYPKDKFDELEEKRGAAGSLMGVLAAAETREPTT